MGCLKSSDPCTGFELDFLEPGFLGDLAVDVVCKSVGKHSIRTWEAMEGGLEDYALLCPQHFISCMKTLF